MPFLRRARGLRRSRSPSLSPLALLAVAPSRPARAQTASDADRAAARELATQGLQLQQAGNFTDALDRFDRAQAVFSAPTHLLHIAQCEAALGKLVEAAETYRTLVRTPLPTGAPAAFVQAQQEGAAELSQVEPRIPSIRLFVKPANLTNLQILIDGQAMSNALVGVQRPTDPGAHSIALLAPGYARADQQVVLKEKETKDVVFNLGGSPGTYYAPVPAPAPSPAVAPNAAQPATPPAQYNYQPMPPAPPPPERPEHEPARGGFMLGGTLGVLLPGGNLRSGTGVATVAGGGAGVALNGGFRFARHFYIGLTYEHGFLSAGSAAAAAGATSSVDSNYIGVDFDVISNPDGVGFYGDIGAGYRVPRCRCSARRSELVRDVRRRRGVARRRHPLQARRVGPPRPAGVDLRRTVLERAATAPAPAARSRTATRTSSSCSA